MRGRHTVTRISQLLARVNETDLSHVDAFLLLQGLRPPGEDKYTSPFMRAGQRTSLIWTIVELGSKSKACFRPVSVCRVAIRRRRLASGTDKQPSDTP